MKPKQFDCVQMKWDIQQQLAEEFAGMPEAEAQRILDQRVVANPILGPILKKVRVVSYPSSLALGGQLPASFPQNLQRLALA